MSSLYILAIFGMSLVTGVFGNNGDSLRDEPPRIKADNYDVNGYVITTTESVSVEAEAKAREFKKKWELYRNKRQKHPEESPTTKADSYAVNRYTTTESVSAEADATPYETEYAKRDREYKNAKELYRQRRQKHQGFVNRCQKEKYIKIKDELGCELCTCIYEKFMMFCSRHECPTDSDGSLRQQISQDLYYDYILHVETNFREYKCTAGDVLMLSPFCDCGCVAPDVLSCPRTCHFGRKLY